MNDNVHVVRIGPIEDDGIDKISGVPDNPLVRLVATGNPGAATAIRAVRAETTDAQFLIFLNRCLSLDTTGSSLWEEYKDRSGASVSNLLERLEERSSNY